MAEFTIVAHITRDGSHAFVVRVSAVPMQEGPTALEAEPHPTIATVARASRREAESTRDMMVAALTQQLGDAGHRVREVERD
jgi:hypothetical protein